MMDPPFVLQNGRSTMTAGRLAGAKTNVINYKKKKCFTTIASLFNIIFILSLFFMAKPVASTGSSPTVVTNANQICGQTLSNTYGYDFSSFVGDIIECNGDGPTVTNGVVFNCRGKAIQLNPNADPASTVGVTVEDAAEVYNCEVSGFGHGIKMTSSADGSTVQVGNIVSRNNMYYGAFITGLAGNALIRESIFEGNSQGVVVHKDVSGSVSIDDSEVRGSSFHGILVRSKEFVSVEGGVIAENVRHGILATRYGADKEFSVTDVEIMGNGGYGIVNSGSQNPVPKVLGVLSHGNSRGAMYSRGVVPEVTCSDLFGKVAGSVMSKGGVCMTSGSCDDRTIACAANPLIPAILSPSDFCGGTLSSGSKQFYELDPAQTYDCAAENGGDGLFISVDLSLDCKNVPVTGNSTGSYDQTGIYISDGDVTIANCDISLFRDHGIIASSPGLLTITNTSIHENAYGMYMNEGSLVMTDVMVTNNDYNGIRARFKTSNSTFWLERVSSNENGGYGGLYVRSAESVYIFESEFKKNNETVGVYLGYVDDAYIEDCEMSENGSHGIYLYDSVAKIKSTLIRDNGLDGLTLIEDCDGSFATVSCSEITGNGENGVETYNNYGSVSISNSMVHGNRNHNFYGDPADVYTLNNIYACGVTNSKEVEISDTTVVSTVVCGDGSAPCGLACDDVSEQSFENNYLGACDNFGWWDNL